MTFMLFEVIPTEKNCFGLLDEGNQGMAYYVLMDLKVAGKPKWIKGKQSYNNNVGGDSWLPLLEIYKFERRKTSVVHFTLAQNTRL